MDVKKSYLNELIRNIEKILRVLVREDITCKVTLSSTERPVMVDPYRIEQVLINLTTNARDAMANGGTLSIDTTMVYLDQVQASRFGGIPAGSYMVLSVADTGSGMDEEILAHIFEPFYSTKDGSKGTGLGMSIVHDIVKQHGAFIDIDTGLQQGTTFHIFFPVYDDINKVQVTEKQSAPEEATILLVDDDWLVRKSLCTFLRSRGYRVLVADNGDEAISQYLQHRESIDLVILDVMLPKKNGREVYDALRKNNQAVKILFVSGSTKEDLAEKNILPDELDFLAKPLDLDAFSSKVEEMLAA